ncbi:MAG TPA: hypothetical protein VMM54_12450 [Nitrospirota bacterium]|nr:hypothetical protein [Nitrospirota bacterium]
MIRNVRIPRFKTGEFKIAVLYWIIQHQDAIAMDVSPLYGTGIKPIPHQ